MPPIFTLMREFTVIILAKNSIDPTAPLHENLSFSNLSAVPVVHGGPVSSNQVGDGDPVLERILPDQPDLLQRHPGEDSQPVGRHERRRPEEVPGHG